MTNNISTSKSFSNDYKVSWKDYSGEDYSKCCIVLPGQTVSYPGMYKQFLENDLFIKNLFDIADNYYEDLSNTKVSYYITNPSLIENREDFFIIRNLCLFVLEVGMGSFLINNRFKNTVSIITGHSFGEFASIVLAGCMSFEDMLDYIYNREILCPPINERGFLISIFSSDFKKINSILDKEEYYISNINSPSQVVIAVSKDNVDMIMKKLESESIKSVLLKKAIQPYHSPFLIDIGKSLNSFLKNSNYTFSEPKIPFFSSVLKCEISSNNFSKDKIFEILHRQIYTQVDFKYQILNCHKFGCGTFIECGPGNVFNGFVSEILSAYDINCMHFDNFYNTNNSQLLSNKDILRKSSSKLFGTISKIVGKITGYEIDSISVTDRFQEDLGLDSIKKADVVFQILDDVKKENLDKLSFSELNTISDLIDFIEEDFDETRDLVLSEENLDLGIGKNFKRYNLGWKEDEMRFKNIYKDGLETIFLNVSELFSENYMACLLKIKKLIIDSGIKNFIFIDDNILILDSKDDGFYTNFLFILEELISLEGFNNINMLFHTNQKNFLFYKSIISFLKSIQLEESSFFCKLVLIDSENLNYLKKICDLELLYPFDSIVKYESNNRYINEIIFDDFVYNKNSLNLNGPFLFIGGSKGITYLCVEKFLEYAKGPVYIISRSKETGIIKDNIDQLRNKFSYEIKYISCDVYDKKAFYLILKDIVNKFNSIPLIVNGAGINIGGKFSTKNKDDIEKEINSKIGVSLSILETVKDFKDKIGKVILFSSISSIYPSYGQSVYSFSNNVLNMIAYNYFKSYGINCISICWPGWYDVGMTAENNMSKHLIMNKAVLMDKYTGVNFFISEVFNNNINNDKIVIYQDVESNNNINNGRSLQRYSNAKYDSPIVFNFLLGLSSVSGGYLSYKKKYDLNHVDSIFKGHKIMGKIYLPASFGIGMILSYVFINYKKVCTIKDFKAQSPIILDTGSESNIYNNGENIIIKNAGGMFSSKFSFDMLDVGEYISFNISKTVEKKRVLNYEDFSLSDFFEPIDNYYIDKNDDLIGKVSLSKINNNISNTFIDNIIFLVEACFHVLSPKDLSITIPQTILEVGFKKLDFSSYDEIYVVSKRVSEDDFSVTGDCYIVDKTGFILLYMKGLVKYRISNKKTLIGE